MLPILDRSNIIYIKSYSFRTLRVVNTFTQERSDIYFRYNLYINNNTTLKKQTRKVI